MNQLQTITRLGVPSGVSKRFACPFCGGSNTLSVTNRGGTLKWFCFKSACDARGQVNGERTASDLTNLLASRGDHEPIEEAFVEPAYWTSWNSNLRCGEWLRRNHSLAAVVGGLVRCRYDPRRDRVAFVVRHRGVSVDAVGRALLKGSKPKWLRYGSSPYPLIVGPSEGVGVIVEDAASACAVSSLATGIAILGTNFQSAMHAVLRPFDKLIIALDKDASSKAVALHARLSYYKPCRVMLLDEDLKYQSPEQIRPQLEAVT